MISPDSVIGTTHGEHMAKPRKETRRDKAKSSLYKKSKKKK